MTWHCSSIQCISLDAAAFTVLLIPTYGAAVFIYKGTERTEQWKHSALTETGSTTEAQDPKQPSEPKQPQTREQHYLLLEPFPPLTQPGEL